MNQEVKSELESELSHSKTSSSNDPPPEEAQNDEQDEALTLAQLANHNRDNSFRKGKRKRKPTERQELFFKSVYESNNKQASSDRSGKNKSHKKQELDAKVSTIETKSPAMIRAEELQLNLEPEFPSFTKNLVRSHVGSCFWMGLPGPFCRTHLPHVITTVTVEDESGELFEIKYIGHKTGLSAGWRQFCVAHNLLEGDVLIFQLTGPRRFKVYIIRANDLSELDGVLGLLNLEAQIKQNDPETGSAPRKSAKKKRKSLPLASMQKEHKKSSHKQRSASYTKQAAEQSENDSEVVGSEVLEGCNLPSSIVEFNNVKSFDEFVILVDGIVIDSELQENKRKKYYNLCCSQNAFLHENIIPGINRKLIVGTIAETINIANALGNCKLTTSRDEFSGWERSLKAFELLGMNVGFLRARLSQLVTLAFESEGGLCTRIYMKAKIEKTCAEEEIKCLEAKVETLKGVSGKCETEIKNLKSKANGYDMKIQEEVAAPW